MENDKNIEQKVEVQALDLSTEQYTKLLAEAPVYAKKAIVEARQATEQEEVKTILADGTTETVNIAEAGDMILTNPGGEKYILKPEKFAKRYEAIDENGTYRAKGMARIAENPTGAPIEIVAPWGEKQVGALDCMIATPFDPEHPDEVGNDRYIIGHQEFVDTYGLASDVLGEKQ